MCLLNLFMQVVVEKSYFTAHFCNTRELLLANTHKLFKDLYLFRVLM